MTADCALEDHTVWGTVEKIGHGLLEIDRDDERKNHGGTWLVYPTEVCEVEEDFAWLLAL